MIRRTPPPNCRDAARRGFTLTELLVAATLLMSVISVVTHLTVSTGRLRQETRRETLALDELANQLDRLTAADDQQRTQLLAALEPSEEIAEALPGAELIGETLDDEQGARIVLKLSWSARRDARPLTLVGWLDGPRFEEESADGDGAP